MKHYKKTNKSFLNDCGYETKRNPIEYIVIHYTAGANDTAEAVNKYFVNLRKQGYPNGRYASAHYIVDESNVFKAVQTRFTAWHCGGEKYKYSTGGKLYGKCTNYNSIGIEMCKQLTHINYATLENTIYLVRRLMPKFNIDTAHIIRHYDVTGKHCPAKMIDDTEAYKNNWLLFKKACAVPANTQIKIDSDGTLYKKATTATKWVKIGQFKD